MITKKGTIYCLEKSYYDLFHSTVPYIYCAHDINYSDNRQATYLSSLLVILSNLSVFDLKN